MKARLAGGCGGHVEWSSSTPVSKSRRCVTDPSTAGLVDDASSGRSKSVIRRLSGTVSEASMPPTHLGHAAPLRLSVSALPPIVLSPARTLERLRWVVQPETPWVEAEACGGFKGALAAPLEGRGQKSSGREPDPGRRRSRTAATPRRPGSHSRAL